MFLENGKLNSQKILLISLIYTKSCFHISNRKISINITISFKSLFSSPSSKPLLNVNVKRNSDLVSQQWNEKLKIIDILEYKVSKKRRYIHTLTHKTTKRAGLIIAKHESVIKLLFHIIFGINFRQAEKNQQKLCCM